MFAITWKNHLFNLHQASDLFSFYLFRIFDQFLVISYVYIFVLLISIVLFHVFVCLITKNIILWLYTYYTCGYLCSLATHTCTQTIITYVYLFIYYFLYDCSFADLVMFKGKMFNLLLRLCYFLHIWPLYYIYLFSLHFFLFQNVL